MPPLTLDEVQKREVDPQTGETRLVATNHWVRLSKQGEQTVYVQGGAFYWEGGTPIAAPDPWVLEELAKMTPAARGAVGLPSELPGRIKGGSDGDHRRRD